MTFVRRKTIGGRTYLYEVESTRDADGTVRQHVVKYLGPELRIYGTERKREPARPRAAKRT